MKNFKDLSIDELKAFFEQMNEKKFRAEQVYSWLMKGARNFDEMTNLSESLRNELKKQQTEGKISLGCAEIKVVQESATDGTRKYLLELEDGRCIESVFMKYKYGNSICISSQAGCRMGCAFCASTIGGLERNLSSGEMLEQIIAISRDAGEPINHIVVMGTGEPFDNYENLRKFLDTANSPKGLGISMRNITISTCGLVPKIEKFAEEFKSVGLAVSLHAPNNKIRDLLMPINKSYPLENLMPACKKYTEKTGRRITFEYSLVKGVNDSIVQAEELSRLIKKSGLKLCHVNLIPLNTVSESGLLGSGRKHASEFCKKLNDLGIAATVRRELGADIDAACGQLRLKSRDKA